MLTRLLALPLPARIGLAVLALVAALLVARLIFSRFVPPIHDISTDLEDPPVFVAVLPLRAKAPNAATHGGPRVAALQRRFYPDLVPLETTLLPATLHERALAGVIAAGWHLVASDPATGRIEATAQTRLFRFRDDIVIRIRPTPTGSRLDIRSVSRLGKSDLGTNARRVRAFLGAMGAGG
jgi:hypothetical protein